MLSRFLVAKLINLWLVDVDTAPKNRAAVFLLAVFVI